MNNLIESVNKEINTKKIMRKKTITNKSAILEYYFNNSIVNTDVIVIIDSAVSAFTIPKFKDFNKL